MIPKRKSKEDSNNFTFIYDEKLDPYFIEKDQYCYTIRIKNPDGSINGQTYGHYTQLINVIRRICSLKQISGKNYDSIEEYINKWKEVHDSIKNLVDPNI